MLGDSFRRLQADELDLEWDQLVRNESRAGGDALSMISSDLNALIPHANPEAKARVHHQLFNGASIGLPRIGRRRAPSMVALSMPNNSPQTFPAKRWWSSPMAALEVVVACVVIAALAVGISIYQSNDSNPWDRSFTAAESTPEPLPTPDLAQLRAMWDAAPPTLTSWDGAIGSGRAVMNLSEVYFPIDAGYSVEFTGVNLVSVLSGTVMLTTDSGEPMTITSGQSTSSYVNERYEIRNSGSEMAYIVHGLVYQESVIAILSKDQPNVLNYYAYFLGNAVLDMPTDQATISLEIFDETTVNRTVRSDATELFLNRADPVSLVVTGGDVGIRSPMTSSEEYRTGGGYDPITIGSTTVLGRDSTEVLVPPGATFSVSAPLDSNVLAISLRIEPDPVTGGSATPATSPGVPTPG